MCFLSLRERHVSSQFDDFSQRIHPSFTNVHRLIASRSLCSLCALILPRQTPFHFHWLCVPFASTRSSPPRAHASSQSALIALYSWLRSSLRSTPAFAVSTCFLAIGSDRTLPVAPILSLIHASRSPYLPASSRSMLRSSL